MRAQYQLVDVLDIFNKPQEYFDRKVTVGGWIKNNRDSKSIGFIALDDGSCFKNLQLVYSDKLENFAKVAKLNVGASVIATGTIVATPEAKQPLEMQVTKIEVEGESSADYPLQKKRHSFEYLRTIPHLRVRTNTFEAVMRVRSLAAYAIHKFFQERDFVYVHAPEITGSDAEGAGEMFQVTTLDLANVPKTPDGKVDYSQDFFGKPTNAAEFWMIEPEICFADLEDDMELAEAMLKYVINYVLENAPDEMAFFNQFIDKGLIERLHHVASSDFGRITYTDAVKILEQHNDEFENKVYWGCDLQTEHERFLTEKEFGRPVFVTDYPKEIKAFYMKLNPDGKTVAACDCLVPGIGEIIGGSQREDDLDLLTKRMEELHMDMSQYQFYLDLRRYGSVRHAGFGLGFERCVMYLTGMENIRDVLPFPRTVGNCEL